MTDFKIFFDDAELTEYFSLTAAPTGRFMAEFENPLQTVGKSDGASIQYTRIKERYISLETFSDVELTEGQKNRLVYLLYKTEDCPLVFSDRPNEVWYGRVDGSSEFLRNLEHKNEAQGELTFIIPAGVSYAKYPRIFNNIKPGTTGENLVLDPEFRYKDKYWKAWAHLLNETHDGSQVLNGTFDETTPLYGGWNAFTVHQAAQREVNVSKGDAISWGIDFRIDIPAEGDVDGSKTFACLIEEYQIRGGKRTFWRTIYPSALNLNQWQTMRMINYTIQGEDTRYINIVPCIIGKGSVTISKPQLNLGATLLPYAETEASLLESVEVMNQGTYRAWPIIRAKMNGENGLVAFANNKGAVLQFGNPEETDIKTGKRSDKVLDIPMRNNGSLFTINGGGVTTYPNYVGDATRPNLAQGSISWTLAGDGMTPVFSTGSATAWHGPRARITSIPKNYANLDTGDFKFENRINFDTNAKKQGRIEMVVGSGTDYIMAITVRDSSATKEEIVVEFWTIRGRQKMVTLDRKKFYGAYFGMEMSRIGQKLEFKFTRPKQVNADKVVSVSATESLTINCPEAYGLPVTELSCWFQRFQTTNHVGMQWWDSKFTWINEPTVSNVPNTFNDGDLLEIDVKKRLVMVNGVENNQLHALGNMWDGFALDTGMTTIQPVASSWANMYECEIEVQEAYV